ncbi:MAG: hypothetical protein KF800_14140 [Lysobacter sp.]|nr:hypothetical protein [Lysobacter sp.]
MGTPLTDLDELILKCRDEGARIHISEAVRSYRAGAFRSAIVSTWVAVCFDIMEKLRELALAGDLNAAKKSEHIEQIRSSGDVRAALDFEKKLLSFARDEFELLSPLQCMDLERLYADRNRCAHPSLIAEETAYSPSAELARLHILSAVEHLLQYPPVQGKFALNRVLSTINSEYFPKTITDAIQVLDGGPLRRPKDSLVRSVVVVILKQLIEKQPRAVAQRLMSALGAILKLHFTIYEAVLKEKISTMFRAMSDGELDHAIMLSQRIPHAWDLLEIDVVTRFQQYVLNAPSSSISAVVSLESFGPLSDFAQRRIKSASRKELSDDIFFELTPALGDRFVDLYLQSESFRQANEWARELISYKSDFNIKHVTRLIEGISSNDQVMGSNRLGDVIRAFRATSVVSQEAYDEMLRNNGLSAYAHVDRLDEEEEVDR